MAQVIKNPNIFGRIGSGLAKGLSEQLPKEVERSRLASGLEKLGNQKGLTPFQQFSGLASLPGTNPQIIQSGADILRQQSYLDALKNQYENNGIQPKQNGYKPQPEELNQPMKGEIPTLSDPKSTEESYKNYIPPTEQTERAEAYENFQKNPARYGFNFDNALAERKSITSRNKEIQTAYNDQEKIAVDKESKVKKALKDEIGLLGLNSIPAKAYQKFEEKILNSLLPKKDGGMGFTQEQAIKHYSDELNQANREYLSLGTLSPWSPLDFNRRSNTLQKEFASRGEQQMMMDKLIADYEISPMYAAHKAYPIKKGEVPTLNKLGLKIGAPTIGGISIPRVNDRTYESLKKEMGKTHSPMSIAYELQQKGQNPRGWLNYLNDHRDNLEVWQADQLKENVNILDLKDMWLKAWE